MSATVEHAWLMETVGGRVKEFYASIGVDLPDRGGEEATIRCFANPAAHSHEDRKPSCSVNLLTGLWHCQGCSAGGNAYHAALAVGRSETSARDLARAHGLFIETAAPKAREKLPNERQLKKWRDSLRSSARIVARLVEVRGWTPRAMVRCGLGWDGERVTFPVRDHRLKIVGVVRYLPGGEPKSLAWPGSKRLMFPAPEVTSRSRPVFLVEGEPDAVAVWSCGHQAVAVPGAGSWRPDWAQRLGNRQIVILPDCDPQGRGLARRVTETVPTARVVELDSARVDGWDIGNVVAEASREGGLWQATRLLDGLV